jgi:hypothetical protein
VLGASATNCVILSAVTGEPHSMARVGDFLGLLNSEF